MRTAYCLAGIRVEVEGLSACRRDRVHLHGQPRLQPGSAGADSAHSRTHLGIPQAIADEDSGVGYGLKLGDFIPVDRDGSVESAEESVAAARRAAGQGLHITTFVEGTRSRDGRLLPFKKGPFYLAMEAGAPCVPVSISGPKA